ncbi:unnamed protein product [Vitrella brassicaformis CCMP3155]|uniref:SET domain-containing protein n=1 Tax=Vitrella brassicaformis (strain CCMP3155) TaxID=1169540 RepID=A0A0G4G6D1_VITBC|nr:unnamed protein product [Vitrella brassicaformis CCMP3155]|eukprot:CEM24020.1 unnamed protein product [Vitrella brassicaformis CCMP3155]
MQVSLLLKEDAAERHPELINLQQIILQRLGIGDSIHEQQEEGASRPYYHWNDDRDDVRRLVDAFRVLSMSPQDLYFLHDWEWDRRHADEGSAYAALDTIYDNPSNHRKALFRCQAAVESLGLPATHPLAVSVQQQIDTFCQPACGPLPSAPLPMHTQTHSMQQWLSAQGGLVHPHMQLASPEAADSTHMRGWYTTGPIESGTTVLSVPEKCLLNVLSALSSAVFGVVAVYLLCPAARKPIEDAAMREEGDGNARPAKRIKTDENEWAELPETIPCDVVLMLFLLLETRHPSFPLSLIPDDTDSLLLGPPEVLDFLEMEAVKEAADTVKGDLYTMYCGLFSRLGVLFPHVFAPPSHFGWDRFLWAKSVIDSRCVALRVDPPPSLPPLSFHALAVQPASLSEVRKRETNAMADDEEDGSGDAAEDSSPVPFLPVLPECKDKDAGRVVVYEVGDGVRAEGWLDMADGRCSCLVPAVDMMNHHARGQCDVPRFDAVKRCVDVSMRSGAKQAGVQVFLSYGPLQSWESLLHYGFTAPPPNPHDTLALRFQPPDDGEAAEAKEFIMAHHDIPVEHLLRVSPPVIAASLWTTLRVCLNDDIDSLPSILHDKEPLDPATSQLDALCLSTLEQAVREMASRFGDKLTQLSRWKQMVQRESAGEMLGEPYPPHWLGDWCERVERLISSQHAIAEAAMRLIDGLRQPQHQQEHDGG